MNTKLIAGGTLTGLVLAGGFAGLVSAQSVANATGLTEEQVIEIALMEVPGEVTEVELERRRGEQVYEVELLSQDGVEMEVRIAAETGEILKVQAEGEDCDSDHDDDDEA
ncbi:PepSY domain-containing protein [Octadecabacter sp. G9-8]|uniref:PepSY domain-containing protein n=1 Tax=Octadecabacter dasysiphoniae TaxID=2909341 RepID=A0ABS9CR34_9RHOB|nr:PepSY domain-containing protein [Octadecabacter dasysiphoniae]MCF2869682.1 PepSY domain-containing protein [Octadecabacter dasysiphoniae]